MDYLNFERLLKLKFELEAKIHEETRSEAKGILRRSVSGLDQRLSEDEDYGTNIDRLRKRVSELDDTLHEDKDYEANIVAYAKKIARVG